MLALVLSLDNRRNNVIQSKYANPMARACIRASVRMKVRHAIKLVEAERLADRPDSRKSQILSLPIQTRDRYDCGHPSQDLDPGTKAAILKQAGLKK